jgi:hypothetical protein
MPLSTCSKICPIYLFAVPTRYFTLRIYMLTVYIVDFFKKNFKYQLKKNQKGLQLQGPGLETDFVERGRSIARLFFLNSIARLDSCPGERRNGKSRFGSAVRRPAPPASSRSSLIPRLQAAAGASGGVRVMAGPATKARERSSVRLLLVLLGFASGRSQLARPGP